MKKRIIKTTLISYIITAVTLITATSASALCLPSAILNNSCGGGTLQSLLANNNCGTNAVQNGLCNVNQTCLTDIITNGSNCDNQAVAAINTKKTITTSKAAVLINTGNSSKVKVSAKNVNDIAISVSNSCAKATICTPLNKNGKAEICITGICGGTANVKIYSKSNPSVSRTISVIVSGKACGQTGGTINVTKPSTGNQNTGTTGNQNTGTNGNQNTGTTGNQNNGTNATQTQSYAEEVLKYVNEARAANGLKALKLHSTLSKAADIRAKEIIQSFSHTRPDGRSCFTAFSEVGLNYKSAGENIASGYKDAKSVVNAWLASPGHRANILSPNFTYMGISKNGTHWAQLFATI